MKSLTDHDLSVWPCHLLIHLFTCRWILIGLKNLLWSTKKTTGSLQHSPTWTDYWELTITSMEYQGPLNSSKHLWKICKIPECWKTPLWLLLVTMATEELRIISSERLEPMKPGYLYVTSFLQSSSNLIIKQLTVTLSLMGRTDWLVILISISLQRPL